MSNKCPIDRSLRPVPFSQLADRSVDWLWCGWLALGNLNILDGDPGIGKTLLTLDFCARATRGKAFPGNVAALGPVNVVLCNAEDAMEETLRPRLRGMGADLERVFGIHDDESGLAGSLRFPSDKQELDKILTQTKARLVVIDPIVAFLDRGIQSSNDQSVRRALRPLMTLARKHQCAILLVRHLNKSGGRRALYRGGGSIGFVGSCRSALVAAVDPQQPERRVLAPVKQNLAALQPSLAHTVEVQNSETPAITWLGPTELTADELLAVPTKEILPFCTVRRPAISLKISCATVHARSRR
jgi:putative DNA primase/helicase